MNKVDPLPLTAPFTADSEANALCLFNVLKPTTTLSVSYKRNCVSLKSWTLILPPLAMRNKNCNFCERLLPVAADPHVWRDVWLNESRPNEYQGKWDEDKQQFWKLSCFCSDRWTRGWRDRGRVKHYGVINAIVSFKLLLFLLPVRALGQKSSPGVWAALMCSTSRGVFHLVCKYLCKVLVEIV